MTAAPVTSMHSAPKSELDLNMDQASLSLDLGAFGLDTFVRFKTSLGVTIQATLLQLAPQAVSFELCMPDSILSTSEVLSDFRVFAANKQIFQGQAIVRSLVDCGAATICQTALSGAVEMLSESLWENPVQTLPLSFRSFLDRWEKHYKVSAEYKLALAELQSFLHEFRLWMDRVELTLEGVSPRERWEKEKLIARNLPAASALDALLGRFELAASAVPEELSAAHRAYCRRQLHPLLLCAPFMHRIYAKPLGYAGDYEMMNMIFRNQCEGATLFAKLLQSYILNQAPAQAVRNRARYFTQRFVEETLRISMTGKTASFCSIGCGPAREVDDFLGQHALADQTEFHLMDFNDETLRYTSGKLGETKTQSARNTQLKFTKRSVQFLLREQTKSERQGTYDLVYCSGLYDYLSDRVCKSLNTYLYELLRPGGVLIVNNFDPSNPIRYLMEHAFDWYLIHRNGRQLAALAPAQAADEDCVIRAEPTGTTIFLEVRKPPLCERP